MSEQKPTWQVFACAGENAPNYWIVSTRAFKGTVLCQTHSEDYARRIVACVNACEGLSTEQLERFPLDSFKECAQAGIAATLRELELEQQRDELLAACATLVRTVDATGGVSQNDDGTLSPAGDPDWIDLGDAYEIARAAIAKCKQ